MADRYPEHVVEKRLIAIEAGQVAMNGALGLMLETLQVQTNLLRELTGYAREAPGQSPVVKTLRELIAAIEQMDVSVEMMASRFESCSQVIAAAFGLALDGMRPPSREAGAG